MNVGLMPYIPDQFILRHIKDFIQGQGQLHHAQVREPGGRRSPLPPE
jgi:hypothetical protein